MKQNLLNKLNIQDKSEQELLGMLKQKLDVIQLKLNGSQISIEEKFRNS